MGAAGAIRGEEEEDRTSQEEERKG